MLTWVPFLRRDVIRLRITLVANLLANLKDRLQ